MVDRLPPMTIRPRIVSGSAPIGVPGLSGVDSTYLGEESGQLTLTTRLTDHTHHPRKVHFYNAVIPLPAPPLSPFG